MLVLNHCFKCYTTFDDQCISFSICFVCRKCFCKDCYSKHKHTNVDTKFETLYDIIKEKIDALYTPLRPYNWNNCLEIERDARMERITMLSICHQRTDFNSFQYKMYNAKERFHYFLCKMLLKQKFIYDVLEHIMTFI